MGRDTKKGVITSPAKDANALRDLIKRAESNYQTFVNEQGVANAELLKNSLNGTLLKTQTLMEITNSQSTSKDLKRWTILCVRTLVCKLEKYMMQLVQIMHKVKDLTDKYQEKSAEKWGK